MNYRKLLEEQLREAACFGHLGKLKGLISMGVDVNSKNGVNGWTALHWAACRGNVEAVLILLSNGAERTSVTHNGDLPSDHSSDERIKNILGGELSKKQQQQQLPIIPNYLKNPPLLCQNINKRETKLIKVNRTESQPTVKSDECLILRVRNLELTCDFTEIELPKSDLSFWKLQEVCCKELHATLSMRFRKLPNTIIRNDKDVLKLNDFQEIDIFRKI